VTLPAAVALRSQIPQILDLAETYYRFKQRRMGLDVLHDHDLEAALPGASSQIGLDHALSMAEAVAASLHPRYAPLIQELRSKGALFTDCEAARSPTFYAALNFCGGLPLVHAPYRNDVVSFLSLCHELGHACHSTVACELEGVFSALALVPAHLEAVAMAFEILGAKTQLERARSASERVLWACTMLEQILHFLRVLHLEGLFHEELFSDEPRDAEALSAARLELRKRLTPGWIAPSIHGPDHRWLLNTFHESMPFYGDYYAIAFAAACHLALDEHRPQWTAFAHSGHLGLVDAARTALGVDLESAKSYEPVWTMARSLLDVLAQSSRMEKTA
jgi:oligoendopeptidase F